MIYVNTDDRRKPKCIQFGKDPKHSLEIDLEFNKLTYNYITHKVHHIEVSSILNININLKCSFY